MSSDWWARKMNNAPARAPLPPLPPMPSRQAQPAPYQPPPQPDVQVTGENIAEAAMTWRGGEAMRTETQLCPNCGSDLFFHRANTGAKPRCYSCGYTQGQTMQGMPPA